MLGSWEAGGCCFSSISTIRASDHCVNVVCGGQHEKEKVDAEDEPDGCSGYIIPRLYTRARQRVLC